MVQTVRDRDQVSGTWYLRLIPGIRYLNTCSEGLNTCSWYLNICSCSVNIVRAQPWFVRDQRMQLSAHGYTELLLDELEQEAYLVFVVLPGDNLWCHVPHPCNYCRYGLHRAGPTTSVHTLPHIWDRSRPWFVSVECLIRVLDESVAAGRFWYIEEPDNYYCETCHMWWEKYICDVWDAWIEVCLAIAQRQPQLTLSEAQWQSVLQTIHVENI